MACLSPSLGHLVWMICQADPVAFTALNISSAEKLLKILILFFGFVIRCQCFFWSFVGVLGYCCYCSFHWALFQFPRGIGVHGTMLATGSGSLRKGAAKWDRLYNLCACKVFGGVMYWLYIIRNLIFSMVLFKIFFFQFLLWNNQGTSETVFFTFCLFLTCGMELHSFHDGWSHAFENKTYLPGLFGNCRTLWICAFF